MRLKWLIRWLRALSHFSQAELPGGRACNLLAC